MKTIFLIPAILLSSVAFSQQQQQLGNIYLDNKDNPQAQIVQTNYLNNNINYSNVGNVSVANDDIQIVQQTNETNESKESNKENDQEQQSSGNNGLSGGTGFNLSLNVSARSFSSSGSSSSSKSNKHTFSKKLTKFKRNFYGKIASHKKSRHQVDICFNWRS